eukprot:m.9435 g.9435  ORF g.9435 m.9435 type:complete len:446 (-) comp5744_c0_seq1:105-1442(-)
MSPFRSHISAAVSVLVILLLVHATEGRTPHSSQVITGAQLLVNSRQTRDQYLKGRVGIISNPTGIINNLTHIVDFLAASEVDLVAIYGPEHGFRGDHQAGQGSGDVYIDNRTGLPVYSLYQKEGQALADVLNIANLTTLVFDIQDVGCRFYTYIWTLWDTMLALPDTSISNLVVLDRPNPIRADIVQGPVLDLAFASFIGRYSIPLRHGMTVGELAHLFYTVQTSNSTAERVSEAASIHTTGRQLAAPQRKLSLYTVQVVKMVNYARNMLYSETALPWVPPSPNMPTLDTALVYPGIGIIEGTNLSEGRGTTTPFNLFGAGFFNYTYVDALRQATQGSLFEGGAMREAYFVPTFDKFEGNVTTGAQLYVTDTDVFQPIPWGLAAVQQALYASPQTQFFADSFDLHLGNNQTRLMLSNGTDIAEIVAQWQPALEKFMALRQQFLLY